jgi:carbamoyltransferase
LAYVGGVALNAVVNRLILQESRFENLYVQPAAGDNGLALGCAFYGWLRVLRRERLLHDGSSAFGRIYQGIQIVKELEQRSDDIEVVPASNVVEETAALLAEGLTVGWFQGSSEFGPRALGHRSILADPRLPHMRDHINAKIKAREDFRPFAPAVLDRHAKAYFDLDSPSPYMLLVAPMRVEHRTTIPSVVHVDGSSRIQTVEAAINPKFFALLEAFAVLTGLPVLLNTSFNRRRMPIVETPGNALDFFLECDLDVLVIEEYIVRKKLRIEREFVTLDEAIRSIEIAVNRHRHTIPGQGGVCELRITGTHVWTVRFSPTDPPISTGATTRPHAIVEMGSSDLCALFEHPRGEVSRRFEQMFDEGRVQVHGSLPHAAVLFWILQQGV